MAANVRMNPQVVLEIRLTQCRGFAALMSAAYEGVEDAISPEQTRDAFTRPGRTPPGVDAPMVRIGFLGRDDRAPKGLGAALLRDAGLRVSILPIGVFGITLDAETEELANRFYVRAGFDFAKISDADTNVSKTLMYAQTAALIAATSPKPNKT